MHERQVNEERLAAKKFIVGGSTVIPVAGRSMSGDDRYPEVRPVRHVVHAAARARAFLLGPLPGAVEPPLRGRHPARYQRAGLVHHRDARDYRAALPGRRLGPGRRLRRDPADLVQPLDSGAGIAAWTWKPVPEPALGALAPRGRTWELTRYRAYQAQLASRTVGEIFTHAVAFLDIADDVVLSRTYP
jgi:hypothetical protein